MIEMNNAHCSKCAYFLRTNVKSSALTHLLGTLLALLKCLLTPVPGVVGGAGLFTALFQHLVASSLHSCGGAEGSKSRFWKVTEMFTG